MSIRHRQSQHMGVIFPMFYTLTCTLVCLLSTTLLPAPLWAGTVQIEAGKMTLYHKKNQVVFSNNVHLTREDFELYCDRLVAYYTDKNLDHADAFGHIRLRHGKAKGTADKAVLNQAGGTITLTGNASLEQDGNHVEGDQIVHDMNRNQTVVLPVKGGRTHMTIESGDSGNDLLPATGKQP